MNIFWGLGGPIDSTMARVEAADARRQAGAARTTATDVESRLERTMLACEAMWSLLREKLGATDLELLERMNQLDLTDGRLDGKISKTAVACPKCNRTITRRHAKCMYCGQPIMHDPFA
jgi:hypothetical protein